MDANELIKAIYKITQGTPIPEAPGDLDTAKGEIDRLDKALQNIDYLCDVFISEHKLGR